MSGMRLLVSVRDLGEARSAAAAGVDFIDLKDPAAGALGALPVALTARIVQGVRAMPATGRGVWLSATTGDQNSDDITAILASVAAVAATGVDFVKVGIDGGPGSAALLRALASCDAAVVPVLLADQGVDMVLADLALRLGRFPALMLDTADKGTGSLLDRVPLASLQRFVDSVQAQRLLPDRTRRPRSLVLAGIAGALRAAELPALRRLAPDFAGFRSAVCVHHRAAALDPTRLTALCDAFRQLRRDASPAASREVGI